MLFSPRIAPSRAERMWLLLWPRRSFARSARYLGWRVMRLSGNPHNLAVGVAVGFFVSALPIVGAQMLLAALIAWMLRGSIAAALLATFLANPVVTPLLWLAAYAIGQVALGGDLPLSPGEIADQLRQFGSIFARPHPKEISLAAEAIWPAFKPLLIGSAMIGAILAALGYSIAFHLATAYRHARATSCAIVEAVTGMPSGRPS